MTALPQAGCPSSLAPPEGDSLAQDPAAFVSRTMSGQALDLLVCGARCGGCLSKIETSVGALPGVTLARLNLSTGRMRVEWGGDLPARAIVEALSSLGYGASAFDPGEADTEHRRTERSLLIAMAVAAFASSNIMLFSIAVWSGVFEMSADTRTMMYWISAVIAIPAVAYSGQPFFRSAWASVKARRMNMDVPITLAILLALAMSLYETVRGGEHAYYDAACTLLFFLLIGRFLDARLRRRAWAAANALAALQSGSVTRLGADGVAEAVRASDIRPGDMVLVAAGERLAVDAEIVSGSSEADIRLVTGEVEPVAVHEGMILHSGSVNLSRALTVRAVAKADQSLMAEVGRMLEAGEQKRSAYRRIADRASEIYVPVVHVMALLGFAGWMVAGASLDHAVFVAVTVLIITCPCALALAAPVVQVVAAGRLFREGAFLASGDALERIAGTDHVVFDKTGTLTLGDPTLLPGLNRPEDVELAACLARASRHPFSRALARAAGKGPVATKVEEFPGRGVSGWVHGQLARLGSATFVGVDAAGGGSELWFRLGESAPVSFRFADVLRPAARETIQRLADMGITTEIVSGDGEERVRRAAQSAGIDHWIASATPVRKAARLDELEAMGRRVLMVGDGLNDAGALARAHASLAPGGAVDVARFASDCVFSGDSLGSVARIIQLARTARSRMQENFGFSALYNAVAVPIALAGWATPLVAAIAMSASSLIVTLNALRMAGSWTTPEQRAGERVSAPEKARREGALA